jgi:hypothetical protein
MASSEGLEPTTVRLEGACSIQLSYEDTAEIFYQIPKAYSTVGNHMVLFFVVFTASGIAMRSTFQAPSWLWTNA